MTHPKGFTLIEVVVALAIFAVAAMALTKIAMQYTQSTANSILRTKAQFVSQNESCILKIPSAVTQCDFNFLINPNHPDFSKIKIVDVTKFPFDKRIFK